MFIKRKKLFILSIFMYHFLVYIFIILIIFLILIFLNISGKIKIIDFALKKSINNETNYEFINAYTSNKLLIYLVFFNIFLFLIILIIIFYFILKINNKDNYLKYNIKHIKLDLHEIIKSNYLLLIIIINLINSLIEFILFYNSIYNPKDIINIQFEILVKNKIFNSIYSSYIFIVYLLLVLLIFFVSSFIEEYIYRYLYFKIFKNFKSIINLIINALVFSISHFIKFIINKQNYFLNYLELFFISLIYFTYIYSQTKNLLLVIIIHFTQNVLLFINGLIIYHYNPIELNNNILKILNLLWKYNFWIWLLIEISIIFIYNFIIKKYISKNFIK